MKTTNIMVLCGLSLALAACGDSPQQTSTDVRADGQDDVRQTQRDVADTRLDRNQDGSFGNIALSESDHKIAVDRVQASHGVNTRKCEELEGAARQQCRDTADDTRDRAVAAVDLRKSD